MVFGLIEGRHQIPDVHQYLFPADFFGDMFDYRRTVEHLEKVLAGVDFLSLYVTGLTVALTTTLKYCHENDISVALFHYDRETQKYRQQFMW